MMIAGRHLPSFVAAMPPRGSSVEETPRPAGPEVGTIPDKPITIQRAWRSSHGNGVARPIMLAIAGDSASGKTTITQGLVDALGPERISSICVDDYHRYDRQERKDKPFTPLHPECNYIEIMEQHLQLLAMGHPVLKPVYNHDDGSLGRPELVEPRDFMIVEGLLPLHTKLARACFDATVYLDPPEEIRFQWKLARDTKKRGYTEDEVREDLEKREPDSAEFIRPQRSKADIVIRFEPIEGRERAEDEPLSATILLRPTISHPELTKILTDDHREAMHLKLSRDEDGKPVDSLHLHSYADRKITREVEEAIWAELGVDESIPESLGRMDNGERSEPLAQAQLILLYHLIQARQG